MCFVLLCWTGFWAIASADLLSQCNSVNIVSDPTSSSNFYNQMAWFAADDRYIFCFNCWLCNNFLLLGTPANTPKPKSEYIPRGALNIIITPCPITIKIPLQLDKPNSFLPNSSWNCAFYYSPCEDELVSSYILTIGQQQTLN